MKKLTGILLALAMCVSICAFTSQAVFAQDPHQGEGKLAKTLSLSVDFDTVKVEVSFPSKIVVKVGETFQLGPTFSPASIANDMKLVDDCSLRYWPCFADNGYMGVSDKGDDGVWSPLCEMYYGSDDGMYIPVVGVAPGTGKITIYSGNYGAHEYIEIPITVLPADDGVTTTNLLQGMFSGTTTEATPESTAETTEAAPESTAESTTEQNPAPDPKSGTKPGLLYYIGGGALLVCAAAAVVIIVIRRKKSGA